MTNPQDLALMAEVYRGVLGREPDGDGLAHHAASLTEGAKLGDLLAAFINSDEFAQRPDRPRPDTLLHVDFDPPLRVDLAVTEMQAIDLWAHVGANWAVLGAEDPYWSVLSNPRFRLPNMDDRATLDAFYASGGPQVRRIEAWLGRHGRGLEGASCAEYGCGVGRLTLWLAQRCRHVHAFDISPTHLAHARDWLGRHRITNVSFHLVRTPADLARMDQAEVFFSSIVLQHNPPPIMLLILDQAFRWLAHGGAALFQVPTYMRGYAFDLAEYLAGADGLRGIEMHCLPQPHIFEAAARHGLRALEVQQDNLAGATWASHSFLFGKS